MSLDSRLGRFRPTASIIAVVLGLTSLLVLPTGCAQRIAIDASPPSTRQPSIPAKPGDPQSISADVGIGEWLDPRLRSLRLTAGGEEFLEPIVPLEGGSLLLNFDWMSDGVRDFRYDIVHCDRNWQPSRLSTLDYLVSFTEGDIRDFELSVTTTEPYTSYSLTLPNQYVAWKISGNYLLRVYDDDTGELVTRLRFCVFENLLNPDPVLTRATFVQNDRSHQEFDVSVFLREARIEEARRSLTMSVVQNGDWRYGIYNLPPRLLRGDDAVWDYPGKLAFPAHREWRGLDVRTLLSAGGQIEEVTQDKGGYTAFLLLDLPRYQNADQTFVDLNGKFALGDFDNRFRGRSDYATVIFALKVPRNLEAEPLYLYGGYNGYALNESNRGVYNELTKSYVFRALLRQGYYDYAYVTNSAQTLGPDWATYEGNAFAAENTYQFLIYYHPYGARYDRIIGYKFLEVDR